MTLRRFGSLLAAFLLCALVASPGFSADWPLGRCDSSGTGYTSEAIKPPLSLAWEFNSLKTGRNPAPVVAADTVFFCASDRLVALDSVSGKFKWSYPTDQGLTGNIKASAAYSDGTVYFGASDGRLYAVNAADGILRWTYATKGPIRSAPVISDGTIFFGSDDNSLYALWADNGDLAWKSPFITKDDVSSSPAVSSGYAVFACADSLVYMASAGSGAKRWEYRLPMAPTRSAPAVYDDVVHIAATNCLYAISRKTGIQRWSAPFKSDLAAGPTVAENTDPAVEGAVANAKYVIYVITRSNKLYALNSTGRPKWASPVDLPYICNNAPTVARDTVIVAGERGSICAYSAATSKLIWQYNVLPMQFKGPGNFTAVSAPPVVANGRIYVVTDDGALRCFASDMPDDTVPETFNLTPARGTAMSGSPPIHVSAILYDLGCGVDPSTIELSLDKTVVEHQFDVTNSTVSYDTPAASAPLTSGRHELTLRAKDWKGNAVNTSWSFIADNTLRPPAPPKTTAKPSTRPTPPPGYQTPQAPSGPPAGTDPDVSPTWPHVRRNRGASPPPPPPPGGYPAGPPASPDTAEPAPAPGP